jgi:hypothetical protein
MHAKARAQVEMSFALGRIDSGLTTCHPFKAGRSLALRALADAQTESGILLRKETAVKMQNLAQGFLWQFRIVFP